MKNCPICEKKLIVFDQESLSCINEKCQLSEFLFLTSDWAGFHKDHWIGFFDENESHMKEFTIEELKRLLKLRAFQ